MLLRKVHHYTMHPSSKLQLTCSATKKPKISAAQIRVQKGSTIIHNTLTSTDLTELSLPSTMRISFSNPDDILNFTLTIEPDEGMSLILDTRINTQGMYKGGSFHFSFAIGNEYPHQPPKVRCTQRVSRDFEKVLI
jgi:ubiquitin-conjugating enzyme E2 M